MEGLLYVRPEGSSEARFLSQSLCCRFLCCHHFTDKAAEVPQPFGALVKAHICV